MMSRFCKLFRIFCIVFLAGFLAINPALATNSLFTVGDVKADVAAENAIAAREKAFQEAQVNAFSVLAERMLSASELKDFKMPEGLTLSSLIQDFEVSNEKLSATRYSATYKFRFKDDDVRSYFSGSKKSYTDVARKPVLILPFMEKTTGGTVLWSPLNHWMQAWSGRAHGGGLVPLIVPIGDVSDVNDMGDDEALTYDSRRLSSMVRRYNASEAVIALARFSEYSDVLEVQIYRTDRQRPEFVHQITQPFSASRDDMAVYVQAAAKVRQALRDDWKEQTVVEHANSSSLDALQVRVRFGSLEEWTKVRRALERVGAIDSIDLNAFSSQEAYLALSYQGGFERLNLALQQIDMSLQDFQPGIAGRETIYDLVYRRYGGRVHGGGGYLPAVSGGSGGSDSYQAQF